jgi:hypothetical protein
MLTQEGREGRGNLASRTVSLMWCSFRFSNLTKRCWCPLWRFLRLREVIAATLIGGILCMGPVTRDFFSTL